MNKAPEDLNKTPHVGEDLASKTNVCTLHKPSLCMQDKKRLLQFLLSIHASVPQTAQANRLCALLAIESPGVGQFTPNLNSPVIL